MKKLIVLIMVIAFSSIQFVNASCFSDGKSWSEKIFKGDYGYVFTCKIVEFSAEKAQMTSVGYMGLKAVAQIEKVFFGKMDSSLVYLTPGNYLQVGATYLVYGNGKKNHIFFGGGCDFLSKQIPDNVETQEMKTLAEISDIVNKKLTCHYIIQEINNWVFAEGDYEKGKPVNIWKHYWDDGTIKAEYDFTNNTEMYYDENGLKKAMLERNENVLTYSSFSAENNDLLAQRHVIKKTDYGDLITWFDYYDNGNLQKKYSVKHFGNDKRGYTNSDEIFDYQEYYENGNLKATGGFFANDSVGTWTFYNEKGEFFEKIDYKKVDSLLLITKENEEIEINSYFLPASTFIYGKVTDKKSNKSIEEAYISLYRKGYGYFIANDVTPPDGKYEIRNFAAGIYEVKAMVYDGNYEPVIMEVEIFENEDIELDFQLE